jgi:hypothetical protein
MEGKSLADGYGIHYIETSAKDGINVEEAFFILVSLVLVSPVPMRHEDL